MQATDELYLIRSPFGITDDFAITWANILASIAAQASGTWGISISGNAATATSATTAGSATTATTATNANNGATVSTAANAEFYPMFAASSTNGNQPFNLNSGLHYNPSTGNLTATTFTGSFSGTVTNATNVATTNVSTNATFYPLFVASNSTGNQACDMGTGLTFNPSTNTLTTTTFVGALTGNASTATSATTAGSATTATTATNANNGATVAVSTNASFFPLFVASSSNSNQAFNLGTGLSFNPSTNTLTTTTFSGALNGNATTASNGFTFNDVSGTTQAAAFNNGYVISNASQTTVTLPATAALGSRVAVQGKGAAGWILAANTGQVIHLGSSASSTAGSLTSTNLWDAVEVVCVTANTTWAVNQAIGNLTVA
jgi:hypothetical protein